MRIAASQGGIHLSVEVNDTMEPAGRDRVQSWLKECVAALASQTEEQSLKDLNDLRAITARLRAAA